MIYLHLRDVRHLVVFLLWSCSQLACAAAMPTEQNADQNSVPPPDAGVLNVQDEKYGAKGDGTTDDTAAIQKALSEGLDNHRIVYVPNGRYLISDTLKWWRPDYAIEQTGGWGAFLQLQGQSETGTIFILKDGSPGYSDLQAPKAVIATGSRGYDGKKGYRDGGGNEAFENHLRNFTVNTGNSNPGAIGVDYQVSNFGAMRNVTIRTGGDSSAGAIGLSMARRDNGPGVVANVTIVGFDTGIKVGGGVCQLSYENVNLSGQTKIGIDVKDAVVAVHQLHCIGAVTAAQVSGLGLLSLLDSSIQCSAAASPAVINVDDESTLTLSNVALTGASKTIENRGESVKSLAPASTWSSDGVQSAFGETKPLSRPAVRDTPELAAFAGTDWISVGAPSGGDDAVAIQKALDSGKPAVYFPFGTYKTSLTLVVPTSVKLITGFGAGLDFTASKNMDANAGLFRIKGGDASDTLMIDRLSGTLQGQFVADHASARTLVLRDVQFWNSRMYRNREGAGVVFADDACGSGWQVDFPTTIFARNLNIEGPQNPKVTLAAGAKLWALGFKTESAQTMVEAKPGSRLEMWGGLAYTFGSDEKTPPAFVIDRATAMLSFAGVTFVANGYYPNLVRERREGGQKLYLKSQAFIRGGAAVVPLYVALPR